MVKFYDDSQTLILGIKSYKEMGFDHIRIPGGKSKNEKIYSGVFAFYVGDNGNIYLVCILYKSSFHYDRGEKDKKIEEIKSGLDAEDEEPEDVARREFWEETGLMISEELKIVYKYSVLDNIRNNIYTNEIHIKVLHTKYYYTAVLNSEELKDLKVAEEDCRETCRPMLINIDLIPGLLFKNHYRIYKIIKKKFGLPPLAN